MLQELCNTSDAISASCADVEAHVVMGPALVHNMSRVCKVFPASFLNLELYSPPSRKRSLLEDVF